MTTTRRTALLTAELTLEHFDMERTTAAVAEMAKGGEACFYAFAGSWTLDDILRRLAELGGDVAPGGNRVTFGSGSVEVIDKTSLSLITGAAP